MWPFYGTVKFVSLYICMGKMLKSYFLKMNCILMVKPFNKNEHIYPLGVVYTCSWAVYMYKVMKYLRVFSSEITTKSLSVKEELKVCF